MVPALLRKAWHSEPIPQAVAERAGLISAVIGDLDESVWELVDDEASLQPTANHIRWLVGSRLYHTRGDPLVTSRLFTAPIPEDLCLADLPLSTRTRNALQKAGRLDSATWVADATPSDILNLQNAGATTLLDFATVVELQLGTPERETVDVVELLGLIGDLAQSHPIDEIYTHDPRLSGLTLKYGVSLRVAIGSMIESADSTIEAKAVRKTIRDVSKTLNAIANATLDDSLCELITLSISEGQQAAVARRLGWDGKGGSTLQEAGDLVGVTRERMRQLTKKVEKRVGGIRYVPSLDRAIAVLDDAARRLEPDSSGLLVAKGVTSKPFLPRGVETAANLFGRKFPVRIGRNGRQLTMPEDDALTQSLGVAFRSLTDINHVAHIEELQARAFEEGGKGPSTALTVGFLERQEVVWLDSERQWFWNRQASGRNRYVNLARKILSVTNPIATEVLREGVFRYHRTHNTSLPRSVFQSLCETAGFHVADGLVESPEPLSPAEQLGGTELIFFKALSERENALDLYDLRRICFNRGMSRPAFQLNLIYTPILERLAPAVYALRGRSVDPARVSVLSDKVPTYPRALQDHGWTRDKAYWLSYRVTEPILNSNVVTIPKGVKRLTGERRFELIALDGTSMGEFVIGPQSNAWGIARFMRTRGVDIGDVIVLTLDLELDVAMIQSGSQDLLVTFNSGDGWGPQRFLEELTAPDPEDLDE